jgi:cytoskeletal protein CcmA (bactofilin family)
MPRIKKFKSPKVSTVIGTGTEIQGDLHFTEGLHLDGAVKGNVTGDPETHSTITVSEQGLIEGDVRVDNLILNGTVIGDVYVNERAELASAARVTGTVYYRLLEMAMGAEVNGQLVHTEEQEPRMLGHDGSARIAEKPAPEAGTGTEANT